MICENSSIIFPDTCLYNDVVGYADLSKDGGSIAEVEFATENPMKGTKCYISFVADLDADASGTITAEIVDKDNSDVTVGKLVLSVDDLKDGKEVRVPFFVDKGSVNYALKTTSTISKGGLYATLKYEVG